MWWLGFGGKLQKMTKLVGLAQKLKLSNTVIKGIALIPQSIKLFTNIMIKSLTLKPGESWVTLISRFGKQLLGVNI